MLCGLRAGWGRSRAAAGPGQGLCEALDGCGTGGSSSSSSSSTAVAGEPVLEAAAAAAAAPQGWDAALLWGQIATRGGGRAVGGCCCCSSCSCCCCGEEEEAAAGGAAAAAGMAAPQGYPLSDPGSNSERSADSPLPDDDAAATARVPTATSPEWGEERFRVDRKKLEAMLQGQWGDGTGRGRRQHRGTPHTPPPPTHSTNPRVPRKVFLPFFSLLP